MRGKPLRQCGTGHPPAWVYQDQPCPFCALVMEAGELRKQVERLQARCAELEGQLERKGLTLVKGAK